MAEVSAAAGERARHRPRSRDGRDRQFQAFRSRLDRQENLDRFERDLAEAVLAPFEQRDCWNSSWTRGASNRGWAIRKRSWSTRPGRQSRGGRDASATCCSATATAIQRQPARALRRAASGRPRLRLARAATAGGSHADARERQDQEATQACPGRGGRRRCRRRCIPSRRADRWPRRASRWTPSRSSLLKLEYAAYHRPAPPPPCDWPATAAVLLVVFACSCSAASTCAIASAGRWPA